jgi:hypothetical protein
MFRALIEAVDMAVGRKYSPVRLLLAKSSGGGKGPSRRTTRAAATRYRHDPESDMTFVPVESPVAFWRELARPFVAQCTDYQLECLDSEVRREDPATVLGPPVESKLDRDANRAVHVWRGVLDQSAKEWLLESPGRPDGLIRWLEVCLFTDDTFFCSLQHGCEYRIKTVSESDEAAVSATLPDSYWREVRVHEDGVVYDYRRDGPKAAGLIDWRKHMAALRSSPE